MKVVDLERSKEGCHQADRRRSDQAGKDADPSRPVIGALAVIDPETGSPLASRVGVATDIDGTPLILVSMLSAHTRAILADPRCSLLARRARQGRPACASRASRWSCRAARLERGTPRAGPRRTALSQPQSQGEALCRARRLLDLPARIRSAPASTAASARPTSLERADLVTTAPVARRACRRRTIRRSTT